MSANLIQTKSHSLKRLFCYLPTFFPPTLNVLWSSKVPQARESIWVWVAIPGYYPQQRSGKPTWHLPFVANRLVVSDKWMPTTPPHRNPQHLHKLCSPSDLTSWSWGSWAQRYCMVNDSTLKHFLPVLASFWISSTEECPGVARQLF